MRPLLAWIPLLSLGLFIGCSGKPATPAAGGHDHHHHHGAAAGPHKGLLVEVGEEEFHVEVCHDDATNKVTLYILDGKAEQPVVVELADLTLKAKVGDTTTEHKLPAAPLTGEAAGKSSRFEVVDEKLADAIDTKGAICTFSLQLAGKPRLLSFKGGEAHDEHDEKHAPEKDPK